VHYDLVRMDICVTLRFPPGDVQYVWGEEIPAPGDKRTYAGKEGVRSLAASRRSTAVLVNLLLAEGVATVSPVPQPQPS
jgi:hypothetical protein